MTEKLRAAARQALEALEEASDALHKGHPVRVHTQRAVAALREALAEPEPRNQCGETCERAKLCAICARGIAQQKPVAWMVYTLDGKSVCVTDNPADFTAEHRALPLYTEPFPTDEVLLRQALEALEYYRSGEDYQPTPASEAIIAIKERLK